MVVAGEEDTVYRISLRYRIGLDRLMSMNPHIDRPDDPIAGLTVRIPSPDRAQSHDRVVAPFCPPPSESEFLHNWIPLSSAEKMSATEYDALIVGSGAGGGAALWRLCEQWGANGKKIGMIERGPQYLPTHIMNVPTMNGVNFRLYRPPEITDPIGNRLPQYAGMKLIYALGGRMLLWGGITPRVPDSEIASFWPVPVREMELYYNIAEEIMNVTRTYANDSWITRILLKRLRDNGYSNADTVPVAADLKQTRFGQVRSNVFFSSIVLLARALSLRPFDLAVGTYCAEVLIEDGRVCGVRAMTADKKSYVIRAKNVILSAGALQTPRILLNSRVPGKAIGRYLTNNSYLVVTATVDTRNFPEPLGALGIIIPESEGRPYQLQLQGPGAYFNYHDQPKPVQDEWQILDFFVSGKVESRSENRVFVDPGRLDAYGMPELQVSFSFSPKDEAIVQRMYEAVYRACAAMQIRVPEIGGVPAICRMPPGADNHEFGTCRMGEDPNTSATNAYGQIHGVPGLYVADSSVLPSLGATNPTLSITAAALRTADYIARQAP